MCFTINYAKQTQFPKSQMNVTPYNTKDYGNKSNWTLGENKPNSNPISKQLVVARPRWPESAKMAQKLTPPNPQNDTQKNITSYEQTC